LLNKSSKAAATSSVFFDEDSVVVVGADSTGLEAGVLCDKVD